MISKNMSLLLSGALIVTLIAALFAGCICPTLDNHSGKYSGYDNKVYVDKYYNYTGTLGANERINVDVHNINGDIKVIEGEGNDFTITVKAHGTERDHARFVVEFEDNTMSGARNLHLKVDDKENGVSLSDLEWHHSAEMTIVLPKGIMYEDLQFNTVNGAITTGRFDAKHALASSVNGDITMKVNAERVELINVNGKSEAWSTLTGGVISANTVNGNIIVRLPENASLKIDATAVTGANNVQSDFAIHATENTPMKYAGTTQGYFAGNGFDLKLTLVNGNIQIKKI